MKPQMCILVYRKRDKSNLSGTAANKYRSWAEFPVVALPSKRATYAREPIPNGNVPQSVGVNEGMHSDRRRSIRYQFIADVEIFEAVSGAKLKARTSDLSIGGCFLDMLNPSQKGTELRITIFHANTTLVAVGKVAFVVPNMGMGVAFTNVDGNQVAVLQKWLLESKRSNEYTT